MSQVRKEKVRLNVNFTDSEGNREAGIDYGGLAKEYLRLLIKGGLDRDTGLFPTLDSFLNCKLLEGHEEADSKNFKDLGIIIMAAALSSNTREPPWEDKLITGHFFHDSLIDQIKVFDSSELLGNVEDISSSTKTSLLQLLCKGMEPHEMLMEELVEDNFSGNRETFVNLEEYLGFVPKNKPTDPINKEKWDEYRKDAIEFLDKGVFTLSIEGLHALGKGMISNIPKNNDEEKKAYWESWKAISTEEISESIQGKFDREALAKMFEKDLQGSDAFKEKASFLARFCRDEAIQDHEIQDFIAFVTGAESLPPGVEIKLQERMTGGPSPLPSVHTCSNQLDLYYESIEPPNPGGLGDNTYENFVAALKEAIGSSKDFGRA